MDEKLAEYLAKNNGQMPVLDSNGLAFFQRELDHIKSKTFDVLYPDLTFRKLFPVTGDTPAGADSVTYQVYDKSGKVNIVAKNAKDLPRVDVDGKEVTRLVRTLATSFGYNVIEIMNSQMVGKSLDQKRANAARYAIEREFNRIAWLGDAAHNMYGLLTHPGVPSGNAPTGSWTPATDPSDILADINDAFNTVYTQTNAVERANKLALPPEQYALIATTPRTTTSDKTILTWIIENTPQLGSANDVIVAPELIGAGAGSVDVMAVVSTNPEKMEFEIPMETMFLPEQEQGLEYVVPVIARCAGLQMYYPLSAYLSLGI